MRSSPRVRYPQSVGLDVSSRAIRPRCVNSIVIDGDVARCLNRELLNRVRVELDSFRRVRSNPIGDVILSALRPSLNLVQKQSQLTREIE